MPSGFPVRPTPRRPSLRDARMRTAPELEISTQAFSPSPRGDMAKPGQRRPSLAMLGLLRSPVGRGGMDSSGRPRATFGLAGEEETEEDVNERVEVMNQARLEANEQAISKLYVGGGGGNLLAT